MTTDHYLSHMHGYVTPNYSKRCKRLRYGQFLALVFTHIVGDRISLTRLQDYVTYLRDRYNVEVLQDIERTYAKYNSWLFYAHVVKDGCRSVSVRCNKKRLRDKSVLRSVLEDGEFAVGIDDFDLHMDSWYYTHRFEEARHV